MFMTGSLSGQTKSTECDVPGVVRRLSHKVGKKEDNSDFLWKSKMLKVEAETKTCRAPGNDTTEHAAVEALLA